MGENIYDLNDQLTLSNKRLKILVVLLVTAFVATVGVGVFLHQQTINEYRAQATRLKKDLTTAKAALKRQKDDTAKQISDAENLLKQLTGGANAQMADVLKDALKSMQDYSKSAQDLANYPETLRRPPQTAQQPQQPQPPAQPNAVPPNPGFPQQGGTVPQ